MVDIRPLRVEELGEAIKLADDIFRDSEQISMAAAFPHLYTKNMPGQSYAAFEDGKLVSFLGLVPSVIRVGAARLKVFSLGSVCTHPDYRGKGLASAVMGQVMKHIDKAGASLLLVTGTRSLYTRANCHRFGEVSRFTVEPAFARDWLANNMISNVHIRGLEPTDWLQLSEVAQLRDARYEQSVWDLASLINAEPFASCMKLHHKVLVAEKDDRITGFLVIGVPYQPGQRHQPVAFEWAGDAGTVVSLLAHAVHGYHLERLEVPVSWHEEELMDILRPLPAVKEKNLGTVNILHVERLIEQLSPYLEEKNADLYRRLTICSLGEDRTEVRLDEESEVLEANELVSFIFDPAPEISAGEKFLAALKPLFPILFPYTGGLNYV